jgi:diguanylate cyclase (GGDEF)-like protein
LYDSGEKELVLQSYRSQSLNFISLDHDLVKLDATDNALRFFHRVIEHQEPLYINMVDQNDILPYYTQSEPIQSILLMPLIRRGTLLGILGVDHKEIGAFNDHHIQLLHKYIGLIRHSIHTIDAVFIKNRLLRISNALKEFGGIISRVQSAIEIFQSLKPVIQSVMEVDRYGLWIYKNRKLPMELHDRHGDFPFETGAQVGLQDRIENRVCISQRPVFIPDTRNYQPESGESVIDLTAYLDTVACIPISDQGHCFGVLILEGREKYAIDQHQVQFLESICQMAALATARVHLDSHLSSEIMYDPITGIDNKKSFFSKVINEIYRAKRFQTTFAIIYLQIGNWNKILQVYGSKESRTIMEKVASILKPALRQIDVAARVDQDKFGIILIESKYIQASDIASRLVKQIEEKPFEFDQLLININAHVGIAGYGMHGDTVESLTAVAEEGLRQSIEQKNSSR